MRIVAGGGIQVGLSNAIPDEKAVGTSPGEVDFSDSCHDLTMPGKHGSFMIRPALSLQFAPTPWQT